MPTLFLGEGMLEELGFTNEVAELVEGIGWGTFLRLHRNSYELLSKFKLNTCVTSYIDFTIVRWSSRI